MKHLNQRLRPARQVRKSRREIPRNRAAEASSGPGGDAPFHLTQNPMAHGNNGIEDSHLSIDRTHHLCEIRAVSSDNTQAGYVIRNHQQFKFLRHGNRSRRCRTVLHAALRRLAWKPAGCACIARALAACTVISKTKVLQRVSSFRSISSPTPRRSSVGQAFAIPGQYRA